jgi:hypothetical protein
MTSIINDPGADLNRIRSEEQAVTGFEAVTGDKLIALIAFPPIVKDLYPQVAPSSTYDYLNTTATRIYTKFFTGTFNVAAANQRDVRITHGLTLSKIIGVTAKAQVDCALSMYVNSGLLQQTDGVVDTTNYFSIAYDATKIYLSNFYLSTFCTVPKTYSVRVDYTA